MAELFQSALYLGGGLIFYGWLLLPVAVLLVVSILYIVMEAIHDFRKRHGAL